MPNPTPITPPTVEITIASVKNWLKISVPVAPTALRMPISRVRSITETSMMLAMPIPPTTKEIPAIAPIIKVNDPITLLKVLIISTKLTIRKSSTSDG